MNKTALITGATSGIGKAIFEKINSSPETFSKIDILNTSGLNPFKS